jgi:hypothetical protein
VKAAADPTSRDVVGHDKEKCTLHVKITGIYPTQAPDKSPRGGGLWSKIALMSPLATPRSGSRQGLASGSDDVESVYGCLVRRARARERVCRGEME